MRQAFTPPTQEEFLQVLNGGVTQKRGGGLEDIRVYTPSRYRRGGGLFSMLKSVARTAIPFLIRNFLPSIASAGVGIASDMSEGKKFKDSMKTRGSEAFRDVRRRVASGGGKKNSTKRCCSKNSKKNIKHLNMYYKGDVFDRI